MNELLEITQQIRCMNELLQITQQIRYVVRRGRHKYSIAGPGAANPVL